MVKIKKCLNEWNATVEALGQGKQSILIRKYRTNLQEFILYPTVSYALKDNYLSSFKDEYKNLLQKTLYRLLMGRKRKLNIMLNLNRF